MEHQVIDNSLQHRFEMTLGDDAVAALYYRLEEGGTLSLIHTEVPFEFSGKGYGTQLVAAVLDLVRKSGRKVTLDCPFVSYFFGQHPDYADVVAG